MLSRVTSPKQGKVKFATEAVWYRKYQIFWPYFWIIFFWRHSAGTLLEIDGEGDKDMEMQILSCVLRINKSTVSNATNAHRLPSYLYFTTLFRDTKANMLIRLLYEMDLQSWTKHLSLTLALMRNNAPREKFNFYFSGVFC